MAPTRRQAFSRAYLGLLALLLFACASRTPQPAAVVVPTPAPVTVVSQSGPSLAGNGKLHCHFRLPAYVESVRFSGSDKDGRLVYGPVSKPRGREVNLSDVPISVVDLSIDLVRGKTVVGRFRGPIDLAKGLATLDNPSFDDVRTLQSLRILPGNLIVAAGEGRQLKVEGTFSDGASYDLSSTVQWKSTDPTVAGVSLTGGLTALRLGTTGLDASLDSLSCQSSVTVTSARLVSIRLAPAMASLPTLTTQNFTAWGTFSDDTIQDVSEQVQWSSSNPRVAAIDGQGVAATQGVGTAVIRAALGPLTGDTDLDVAGPSLVNLTVSPSSLSTPAAADLHWHALAALSDGTIRDVTGLAAWTSSLPSVLQVTAPGNAQLRYPAQATMIASLGGMQAASEVNTEGAFPPSLPPPPLVVGAAPAPATNLVVIQQPVPVPIPIPAPYSYAPQPVPGPGAYYDNGNGYYDDNPYYYGGGYGGAFGGYYGGYGASRYAGYGSAASSYARGGAGGGLIFSFGGHRSRGRRH